jgi:hypothetical protein
MMQYCLISFYQLLYLKYPFSCGNLGIGQPHWKGGLCHHELEAQCDDICDKDDLNISQMEMVARKDAISISHFLNCSSNIWVPVII